MKKTLSRLFSPPSKARFNCCGNAALVLQGVFNQFDTTTS
jgi:hypothetical protein